MSIACQGKFPHHIFSYLPKEKVLHQVSGEHSFSGKKTTLPKMGKAVSLFQADNLANSQ